MSIEQYAPGTDHAAAIFDPLAELFGRSERPVISARESSRHAGLAAEIMLEDRAGVPADVDHEMAAVSDWCLYLPPTSDLLAPLFEVVRLQLLAFHLAILRGLNVDQPGNLVKAVIPE